MILKSRGFWEQNFDLVAYSPMKRAVETSCIILPDSVVGKSQCLEILREISPIEQLIKSRVAKKIQEFESWLSNTPPSVKKLVLIGHCQYFNSLLGMKTLMRNCDVWQSEVTLPTSASDSALCEWTAPVLLHRSGLSEPHPIGKLFESGWKGWGSWGPEEANETEEIADNDETNTSLPSLSQQQGVDDVVDDLDENSDEPTCRICQVR